MSLGKAANNDIGVLSVLIKALQDAKIGQDLTLRKTKMVACFFDVTNISAAAFWWEWQDSNLQPSD